MGRGPSQFYHWKGNLIALCPRTFLSFISIIMILFDILSVMINILFPSSIHIINHNYTLDRGHFPSFCFQTSKIHSTIIILHHLKHKFHILDANNNYYLNNFYLKIAILLLKEGFSLHFACKPTNKYLQTPHQCLRWHFSHLKCNCQNMNYLFPTFHL